MQKYKKHIVVGLVIVMGAGAIIPIIMNLIK